jgi:hypothetical protein
MAVIRPDFYLTTHLRHRAGLSHARIPVRIAMTKRPAVVLGTPAAGLGTNSRYDERRRLPMKVTATRPPAARTLAEICEDVRRANCGECWALPGDECVFTSVPVSVPVVPGTPVRPVRGYHVARFARAQRRGLISGPDLMAVLDTAGVFTTSTVIYDEGR